jgi:hypothetical protein
MRKPAIVFVALVLGLAISTFAFAHDHDAKAAASTTGSWKGEIVDVACYAAHGKSGAGHADCAKKCAQSGQPIGLLTADGDMALLVADHADGKAFEAAKGMAGSNAEVTGKMDTKGDLKVITVTAVKAAG